MVAWVQFRLTPLAVNRHGIDLEVSLVEPWHSLMISSRQAPATVTRALIRFWIWSEIDAAAIGGDFRAADLGEHRRRFGKCHDGISRARQRRRRERKHQKDRPAPNHGPHLIRTNREWSRATKDRPPS
jgi:hypothetical protein